MTAPYFGGSFSCSFVRRPNHLGLQRVFPWLVVKEEELQIWATRGLRSAASTPALPCPSPPVYPPHLRSPLPAYRARLTLLAPPVSHATRLRSSPRAKSLPFVALRAHLNFALWRGLRVILGAKSTGAREGRGTSCWVQSTWNDPTAGQPACEIGAREPPRECEMRSGQDWKLTMRRK